MRTALLMVTEEMNLCIFYCKLSLFRNKIFLKDEIHHFGNVCVDTVCMEKAERIRKFSFAILFQNGIQNGILRNTMLLPSGLVN